MTTATVAPAPTTRSGPSLAGLTRALASTAILAVLAAAALLGPALLLRRLLLPATAAAIVPGWWPAMAVAAAVAVAVAVAVAALALEVVVAYAVLVLPLRSSAAPPGSSYPRRCAEICALRSGRVLLSLLRSGPLHLLFLGGDPMSLKRWLHRVGRRWEARILGLPPPRFPIHPDGAGRTLKIPLRDGVETAATLYSPLLSDDGTDRYDDTARPVVLLRTPYERGSLAPWGARFAERGYHVVAQDTRGRFGSTGDFFPMLHEAEDGAATIEWLERQPWCDGSVAVTGVSYLGLAAWAAMREQVPALRAVAPILAATDLHHVMFGRRDQGAAHVELMFRWSYLVIHLMAKPYGMLESIFTFFRGTGAALKEAYMHAPLHEVDTKYLCPNLSEPLEWFHDAFHHPLGTESFWQGKKKFVDFATLDKAKVPPVLLFAGWYDFFCTETLHDYQDLCQLSEDCRLVVGPYTHWDIMSMQPKLFRTLFAFFDRHLLKDECAKDLANVEVFCMGKDMKWHVMETWPPPNVTNREFVLSRECDGVGENNSMMMRSSNDGSNNAVEDEESTVEYVYDPADPTPQIGGGTFNPTNCGRLPQNEVETRDDVLVFTSEPLQEPMTIAGQIQVSITVVSNVEGTDYVARACHVTSDGISENIADGIVRRFDLRPGVATRIDILLSPVMNRLDTGDRLRLHICSCAFPKHGRHLNTSESFHLAVETKLSKQQVILGGDKGGRMILPILK